MKEWASRFPLLYYLERNGIICSSLAQYEKAQRQLDKEEEEEEKQDFTIS
jgi:hypothetical protein